MKYFKHKIENLLAVKDIVTIEYLHLDDKFYYPREKHDFWEMVYVDAGEIIYEIESRQFLLKSGELLFLKPNEWHSIYVKSQSKIPTIFVVCFSCSTDIMNFFIDYISPVNNNIKKLLAEIIEETKNTFIMPFNEKLEVLEHANLGGQQVIRTLLELVIIRLLQFEQKRTDSNASFIKDTNFAETISNSISKYLQDKIYDTIKIDDICKLMNYSKSYISSIFKATTGQSIIEYYYNLKINEAKKIISSSNLSMFEISEKLQFSDPRYFSVVFKKLTGKNPSQYKETINK